MFIKICAHTTLEDALASANAGADAVGFVFAKSKRQVTPAQVAAITPHLPASIHKVGVFDASLYTGNAEDIAIAIAQDAHTAGLTGIQLHSPLNVPLARALRAQLGPDTHLIQTIHWEISNPQAPHNFREGLLAIAVERDLFNAILLDSRLAATTAGGTGRTFPWAEAKTIITSLAQSTGADAITRIDSLGEMHSTTTEPPHHLPHIIVAGGLNADNVVEAIQTLHPFGVDVAGGTESTPGKKDPAKVQAFIAAARMPTW
jgi:phosphoribosylanthranilate isomerase